MDTELKAQLEEISGGVLQFRDDDTLLFVHRGVQVHFATTGPELRSWLQHLLFAASEGDLDLGLSPMAQAVALLVARVTEQVPGDLSEALGRELAPPRVGDITSG